VINVGILNQANHVIYKDDSVFDNSGQTLVVEISLIYYQHMHLATSSLIGHLGILNTSW
jgi:hypothetical protein